MRIIGVAIGVAIIVAALLVAGAICDAAFALHLDDFTSPPRSIPGGGMVILALAALIGGFGAVFAAIRIGRWAAAGWIVLAVGIIDAALTASLFANGWMVFLTLAALQAIGAAKARQFARQFIVS